MNKPKRPNLKDMMLFTNLIHDHADDIRKQVARDLSRSVVDIEIFNGVLDWLTNWWNTD